MTTRSKPKSGSSAPSGSNAKTLVLWLIGAVAVIGLVAVVVAGGGGAANTDNPDLQGAPVVTGENLAPLVTGQADAEIGAPVPEVRGSDFDGTPVNIEKDGKAKMIIFLAHWCPNCQVEVPEVVDWLAQNEVPADVEMITVATSISRTRDNFPPSAWLERENWPLPVILDSTASDVGVAFGASAFPMWAMVDADGNLVARLTGAGQVDLNLWTAALSNL